MNILVTGANGQLGSEMRIVAQSSQDHYIFSDIADIEGCSTCRLDITDADAVRRLVAQQNVQVIVNCAAYTDVNGAETHLYAAELLNATAPRILAEAMAEVGGLLLHISTDYIFGGEQYNLPRREEQTGAPTGVYGRTKMEGEENIKATGCRHIIIRTAWLYSEFGKNFVKTMLQLTRDREELNVVFDQCGTPTYAFDLAQAIFHILENRLYDGNEGTYHYSNEGVTSWYDFAHAIATLAGHTGCRIKPCHSDEFPSPVVRPAYSVLDKTKIKDTFRLTIPHWMESLRVCMGNLMKQ